MRPSASIWLAAGALVAASGALSGCLVVRTEVSWRPTDAETIRQHQPPGRPAAQVELSRRPHAVWLPFVMLTYANRDYGLAFYLSTPPPAGTLDSLRYTIYNAQGRVLGSGRAAPGVPFRPLPRPGSQPPATGLHFAAHTTPYTLPLPIRADSVLRLDFQLYATDSVGQPRQWRYADYRLQRRGRRVGSFF